MKLLGVEVVGDIKVSKSGQKLFKFKIPHTDKVLSSKKYLPILKSLNLTVSQVILNINNLNITEIPKCVVCCNNHVRIGSQKNSKIDILEPLFMRTCSPSCGRSLQMLEVYESLTDEQKSVRARNINSKQTSEQRSERQRKASNKSASKGTNGFQNLSLTAKRLRTEKSVDTKRKLGRFPNDVMTDEQKSNRGRKTYNTRKYFNTLPHQLMNKDQRSDAGRKSVRSRFKNRNNIKSISELINDKIEHFDSKTELRVFKRYYRLLNKYYFREKFISTYKDELEVEHDYFPDYVLKPEYYNYKLRGITLPDIIEIKSGNLFHDHFSGIKVKLINYNKFLSVINSRLSLLVIDNRLNRKNKETQKSFLINSKSELDRVFKF